MTISVLNNLSDLYAANSLNLTNASMQSTLQQLSSGTQINSGANDPAGISMVDEMQASDASLAQQQTNDTVNEGQLQVASGALSQVSSMLDRAISLSTEASNGTLDASQDSAANQEYQSILSEIQNIDTTTGYNDSSAFSNDSGSSSLTGVSADLSGSNLSSPTSAESATSAINDAVANVSQLEGNYGTAINADNASSAVDQTQQLNTESALNAIDATDYGQASSNLSAEETLTDAGISALKQSNDIQQNEITSLLAGNQSTGNNVSLFA
jgi:flagellin